MKLLLARQYVHRPPFKIPCWQSKCGLHRAKCITVIDWNEPLCNGRTIGWSFRLVTVSMAKQYFARLNFQFKRTVIICSLRMQAAALGSHSHSFEIIFRAEKLLKHKRRMQIQPLIWFSALQSRLDHQNEFKTAYVIYVIDAYVFMCAILVLCIHCIHLCYYYGLNTENVCH